MVSKFLIYGLEDPTSGEIRYVGRSSIGLARPKSHLSESTLRRWNTKVYTWIKSLKHKKLEPKIIVLQEFDNATNEELNAAEIAWICLYKSFDVNLTNMTYGGDGVLGRPLSEKHRQRIIETNKTRKYSDATIEKMSNSAKLRKVQKPKKIIQASNGKIFIGYKEVSEYLGISEPYACEITKKSLICKGLTFKIIGVQKNERA